MILLIKSTNGRVGSHFYTFFLIRNNITRSAEIIFTRMVVSDPS